MGTREVAIRNGKKGGRPKGRKNTSTLEKEVVRKMYEQKVMKAAEVLFASQLRLATGQQFLYKISKKRVEGPKGGVKWESLPPKLVTSTTEIEQYLLGVTKQCDVEEGPHATYYFLTTKEPSAQAINSMFDRTLGKPTQPIGGDKDNPLEVVVNQITFKGYNGKKTKTT